MSIKKEGVTLLHGRQRRYIDKTTLRLHEKKKKNLITVTRNNTHNTKDKQNTNN